VGAFAGVDWAKDDHAVCVVDEHGQVVVRETFAHDERGVHALIACLHEHRVKRLAIERPDGLLVDRLLEARPSDELCVSRGGLVVDG
jgi:hypothetical protein